MKQCNQYTLDVHGATVDLAQYIGAENTDSACLSLIIPQQIACTIDCSAITLSECIVDIIVCQGAQVQFIWNQFEHVAMHQKRVMRAVIERDARCTIGFFSVTSGKVQGTLDVKLADVHAEVQIVSLSASCTSGIYALDTTVVHQASETISSVRARDLVFDTARSSFNARTIMQQGVYNADGIQEHKALLFSEYAHAESFPEIEVITDNVSCAHASAVGQLSDEELAYLVARSITPECARKLLMQAFIMQVQASISSNNLFITSIDRFLRYCKELV